MQDGTIEQRDGENQRLFLNVLSTIGHRAEQQDSYGFQSKGDCVYVAVCDGMGGHKGGRRASQTAVRTLINDFLNMDFSCQPQDKLKTMAQNANNSVCSLLDDDGVPLKGGSTLVGILINEDKLYWHSVGDSRAYLYRKGQLVQLTTDQNYHTVIDEQLDAGVIDELQYTEELKSGDKLVNFLGIGELQLIDINSDPISLLQGDVILLMSDGLYRLLSDDEFKIMIENFNNPRDTLMALEMKAAKNAKKDNISRDNMTVAIIKIK